VCAGTCGEVLVFFRAVVFEIREGIRLLMLKKPETKFSNMGDNLAILAWR
jgi:hypothetical protein